MDNQTLVWIFRKTFEDSKYDFFLKFIFIFGLINLIKKFL